MVDIYTFISRGGTVLLMPLSLIPHPSAPESARRLCRAHFHPFISPDPSRGTKGT